MTPLALATDGARDSGEAVPPPWRCVQCGRIIAQVDLRAGTIVLICPRCHAENRLEKPAA